MLLTGCAEREDAVSPYGPGGNALVFVSQTPVQGAAKDVAVVSGMAYVADEPFGISIYDVSNPNQPQLAETYALQANGVKARVIAVDSTARVAAVESDNGLQFFDLLNGHYMHNRGSGGHVDAEIFLDGDLLKVFRCDRDNTDGFNYETFVNTGTADSLWYNNFLTPSSYGNYQEAYSLYGFCLGNADTAYVSRNAAGIAVVEYTTGAVLGELNTAGKIRDAALNGNILCLAAGYEAIITVDVSDPANMQALGSLRIENATDIEWIEVVGNKAVLLDDYDGAFVVDISDPAGPSLIGDMETSDPNNFCIVGDYVYIADEDMGLVIGKLVN